MINATIEKFGYPETLVADHVHWVVLVRPQAPTLGSLILAAKGHETAYGDLPPEAFQEQGAIIASIEAALRSFMNYEKINYLLLMMVDPGVHFHVIPRHRGERTFDGTTYADKGWPAMPDLAGAPSLDPATIARIVDALRKCGLEPGRR